MHRFALDSLARLLRGFVRRTWLVAAVTVVICASFAASAASALLDASYLLPARGPARPAPRTPAPAAPAPRVRPDDRTFVERNMFCSSCAPAGPDATGFALPPAQLIATDIDREARATVHVLASEVQGSWGVGDAIPGLGRVERIAPTWVEIADPTGHRGRLSLRDAISPASPVGPARGPVTASECGGDWVDRIRRFDDQNYEVDRALVRELVTGVAKPGGVRAQPVFDHGEIKGVRLFGVRPCTVAGAVGLANGDTLTAIDGAPLRNMQQLLDLYVQLDQLAAVELSGTRAGKPLVRILRLR
jgi:hypothetical protein